MNNGSGAWPYPLWIAHRGAGRLAPENTLAAFREGAARGYRMFECDVKLSADDVPFLLHDDTLERTTNGQGPAGKQGFGALAQLDAGSWHSRAFAGEPLARLENIAGFCQRNGCWLNIEIKPTPGSEEQTGRIVAEHAARLWPFEVTPPLLSSFRPVALQAAQRAQARLPRALLLDTFWPDWLASAQALACAAVVCHHALWGRASLAQVHGAGMKALAYTVNDEWEAARLRALGIDGLITDRLDLFAPA
jgi:glycerophosphoryl diester phosphodiesterase